MHSRNGACPRMLGYRPPRIAITLLLVATALQLLAPPNWPALPAFLAAGAVLTTIGCGVMLRAWWLFREEQTAICPTADTTSLITNDVYALTRNPMYLGIVLMLLGIAVASGGIYFLIASLVFFLIIDTVFCPFEEAKLTRDFGREFTAYRSTTRRWL